MGRWWVTFSLKAFEFFILAFKRRYFSAKVQLFFDSTKFFIYFLAFSVQMVKCAQKQYFFFAARVLVVVC
jgi:hypothetical protein